MSKNTAKIREGGDAPLPDVVDTADKLVRFVEFFVKQGYNVWPLPKGIRRKWNEPILVENAWLVGDKALKWHWHLFLIGRIAEQFSAHVSTIQQVKTSKHQGVHGILIVRKPIKVDDLLHFFEAEGYIKKAAKA